MIKDEEQNIWTVYRTYKFCKQVLWGPIIVYSLSHKHDKSKLFSYSHPYIMHHPYETLNQKKIHHDDFHIINIHAFTSSYASLHTAA